MTTFTLKLTQESAELFQYRPGTKIGPFKINKIIGEYSVPSNDIIQFDGDVQCTECDELVPFCKKIHKGRVKVIEFECCKI